MKFLRNWNLVFVILILVIAGLTTLILVKRHHNTSSHIDCGQSPPGLPLCTPDNELTPDIERQIPR